MLKLIKFAIGLLLLPVCVGTAMTTLYAIGYMGSAQSVWVPMAAGAACWLVIYIMLPAPMRIYVFGHESTHVLWTWLFGGRVTKFKVTAEGGHVVVTKNNFLISLSPYFFPLYVVLAVLLFGLGHWIWNWENHLIWLSLLIGATYSFHITLTCRTLGYEQSDITSQGYLFSAVIIFMGNAAVLLLGLPLIIGDLSYTDIVQRWAADVVTVFVWLVEKATFRT